MKASGKLFPLFVVCLGILWLVVAGLPPRPREDGLNLEGFAALPVQENGRLMPIDTFARTKLFLVSHRQAVKMEVLTEQERIVTDKWRQDGKAELSKKELEILKDLKDKRTAGTIPARAVSATEWALLGLSQLLTPASPFNDIRMFRIDSDELLQFLELKPSAQFGLYFKLDDFVSHDNPKFLDQVKQIRDANGPQKDDLLENKIFELYQKATVVPQFRGLKVPFMVPPPVQKDMDVAEEKWLSLPSALQLQKNNEPANALLGVLTAFASGNAAEFNKELDRYTSRLTAQHPEILKKTQMEVFFNRFAPYYQCSVLFVAVLLLAVLSWIGWSKPLRNAAWSLGLLTMVIYTWALVLRIIISGYAPVTNLYSSAIFIGWGCALLCLMLELFLRNGIGSAVAAITGGMALIVAHNLLDGDSMGKIVAVLESNFWLSTHVICITFGYTATFVAGFLGIVYVFAGRFTDGLRGENGRMLSKVIYGVVCFAMFLSFVGTVLGGIWADQSWGRFWGWDPKENGALLIVIWNAIILHARWAGMVKSRGIALLAIGGNVVTAWSWFGTNFLGVGLHSYGFMKGAMIWLGIFVATQIAIILIGMISTTSWRSFRPETRV